MAAMSWILRERSPFSMSDDDSFESHIPRHFQQVFMQVGCNQQCVIISGNPEGLPRT